MAGRGVTWHPPDPTQDLASCSSVLQHDFQVWFYLLSFSPKTWSEDGIQATVGTHGLSWGRKLRKAHSTLYRLGLGWGLRRNQSTS